MATVQKKIDIEANAQKAWEKLADVGAISNIVGIISESKIDGEKRVCTMADGGVLEERIISLDHDLMRICYCITKSPMDLEFHSASMQIVPNNKGATFIWTTDLKPDALGQGFDQLFEETLAGIKSSLENDG